MAALRSKLAEGEGEAVVWPSDAVFAQAWLESPLYKNLTSMRLQYVLMRVEQAIRNTRSEDIEIRSALTVEHVMPVKWWTHWPLPDGRYAKSDLDRLLNLEKDELAELRDHKVHSIGNLTLLTGPMNSALQNASYDEKRPEILKHSSLALNRYFHEHLSWNETTIGQRARDMLSMAMKIWPR